MNLEYFLLEDNVSTCHIFKGYRIADINKSQLEKYCLCEKLSRERVIDTIIRNQSEEIMLLLINKSKRNICNACKELLKNRSHCKYE